MSAHAPLAPSSAYRWMACPGSVALIGGEESPAKMASAEGTFFHEFAAWCLEFGFEPEDFIGCSWKADGLGPFTFDHDMADFMRPGLDRLRNFEGELHVERRVYLKKWDKDVWGTLDAGIAGRDLIVVGDWKYGVVVPIYPERNHQLLIYLLGFWDNIARHVTKAEECLILIEQPRNAGGGGEWRCTLDEVQEFGDEVRRCARATRDPDAPRVPGEKQCSYCLAQLRCPEYAEYLLGIVGVKFDDLDADEAPKLIRALSPQRRSFVLRHRDLITSWLTALYEDALQDALAGRPVPRFFAGYGRKGDRKWIDEDRAQNELVQLLEHPFKPRQLISPAEAEKALGKKRFAEVFGDDKDPFITQSDPAPKLVEEESKRERIVPTAERFDDLSDGECIELI